ncbi:hypothetical protein KR52_05705 [Synechococcus sp. KORDI-52]|nr:hypothetical protein KR52_05705 [Synechococcus sp. KORDI-52]
MLRCLSLGLLASAISIAALPAIAQEGSADDLGVMSISLKDVINPAFGFQGALQGAGTPNQAGIGGFLPLSVGDNSVWFVDALANVNFADRAGDIPKDVRNTMPMEPQSTNPPTYPVSSSFFMDSIQMKTASPHRRGEHLPQMGDSLLPENYAINRLECSPLRLISPANDWGRVRW